MNPVLAVGDTCTVGDKKYEITAVGLQGLGVNGGVVQLGNITPESHTTTVSDASGFSGSTFSYTITAVGVEEIFAFKTANTSSGITAAYTLKTEVPEMMFNVTQNPTQEDMTDGFSLPMITVDHTYNETSPGMTQFTDTVTQTPGPLPIVGAGMAFGLSRKLRNRIKLSA